jgi:hypothetical protein
MDGQPAGGCEVVAKLPLDRSENFACQDPDAASDAASLKGDGDPGLDVSVQFQARAETRDDIDALVSGEQNERGSAGGVRSSASTDFVG